MKILHSLLFLLLLAGSAWGGTATEETTISWGRERLVASEQKADSLKFEQYYFKELFGKPLMISLIRGKSPVRYGIGVCKNGKRETVSSMARKHNAAAAVNAGFFTFDPASRPVGVLKSANVVVNAGFFTFDPASRPVGVLKSANVVYNDSIDGLKNRGYLAISPEQEVKILTPAELKLDEFDSIVHGNDLLLRNGRVTASTTPDRHPRTAVGIGTEGDVVLVVVDGRNEKSAGVTLHELALIMKSLGCHDALNLDGGGSSTMYWKNRGVMNYPSDNKKFDHAGERQVHNILLLML